MFGKKPAALWNELDPGPVRAPRPPRRLKARPLEVLVDLIGFDPWPLGTLVVLIGVAVSAGVLLPFFLGPDRDSAHRFPPANSAPGMASVRLQVNTRKETGSA